MNSTRILIVDDDVISRKLLRTILNKEKGLEIVGIAANGKIALERIPVLKPDLVTLDVEMPEMDGLETLKRIRSHWPDLPVIMFSGHTEEGATVTMEALAAGASDYVTKPQGRRGTALPIDQLRADFLPKIRALCGGDAAPTPTTMHRQPIPASPKRVAPVKRIGAQRCDILAIGLSTGGPAALNKLIPALAPGFPVPIVLVQHMPATFTRLLAERLDKLCPLKVVEGRSGDRLERGHLYVAPGEHHMIVKRVGATTEIQLNQNPSENACRPAVDPLFRSVAEVYRSRVLSVVLTGMGKDGLLGAKEIKAAGGQVLIQDEASSVVWGMPGAIASEGIQDGTFPLDGLADEINARVRYGRGGGTKRAKAS
jgi:two-component system, chemotaxis family, protein-glutamate methylesterase/glutaminase